MLDRFLFLKINDGVHILEEPTCLLRFNPLISFSSYLSYSFPFSSLPLRFIPASPPIFPHTSTSLTALRPHARTYGAIWHAILPLQLRVRRQIAICGKSSRQIRLDVIDGVLRAQGLQGGDDETFSDEVEKNEINGWGFRAIGGEGGSGLDVVGLRVKGDFRVWGVVAIGAKIV